MDTSIGRVLIVEDDAALRRTLRTTLDALGFDVGEVSNGEGALQELRMDSYEAIVMDINMPGIGGMETCRRIRRNFTRLPILMLTVRHSEDDKVEALESGADDYIVKPFQTRELTARIRSAIRRFRAPETPSEMPIGIGDITLDPVRRRVWRSDSEVRLTRREFDALRLLMERAGRPVTRAGALGAQALQINLAVDVIEPKLDQLRPLDLNQSALQIRAEVAARSRGRRRVRNERRERRSSTHGIDGRRTDLELIAE